jgi:hypothetical protein
MATTMEMITGAMFLLSALFVDAVMLVIGNAVLGILENIIITTHFSPLIGIENATSIPGILWGIIAVYNVAALIAFGYIVARRQTMTQDGYL